MDMQSQHSPSSNAPSSVGGAVVSLPLGGIKRCGQAVLACVWPIRSGYDVVRILVAVVLLVAAGLKCHQLATEPILEKTWLDARWLLMLTVEFELFFGLWLLSNNLPKLTWLTALGCFSTFTCISLWKAISGYASCGCFGTVHVNPWYTSTLDVTFVSALLIWRPCHFLLSTNGRWIRDVGGKHFISLSQFFRRASVVLLVWLTLGLPAVYVMGSFSTAMLSEDGVILGESNCVSLEPEKWVDKRFPLFPFIEDAANATSVNKPPLSQRLGEGEWAVLVYNESCPKCHSFLVGVQHEFEKRIAEGKSLESLALIKTTPAGTSSSLRRNVVGGMVPPYHWFLREPVLCHLRDGVVMGCEWPNVSEQEPKRGMIESL
jgi:hypothetical protein